MNLPPGPSNQLISQSPTIEEGRYIPNGIRLSTHGITYQLKLLMHFMCRARKHGLKFSLGTEVTEADKFDDVVFSFYKEDNSSKEYRVLQAKHTQKTSKTIKTEDLLKVSNKDKFSLLSYFNSYLMIKQNDMFNGEIKDLIICTNIDLHPDVLDSVDEIDSSEDIIFGHKECYNAKQYKIKKGSELYNELEARFRESQQMKLAASLAKLVINNKIEKCKVFKNYRGWLLANVLREEQTNNKRFVRFQDKFMDTDCEGDVFLKQFKDKFLKSYRDRNKTPPDIDNTLKNMMIELHPTYVTDSNGLSLDVCEDEISTFFDKLVFAVKQPNESELWDIITQEISEDMNLVNGEFVAGKFLDYMFQWINEKEGRFLKQEDVSKIFQSLNQNFARSALIGISLAYKAKFETNCGFKENVTVIDAVKDIFQINDVVKAKQKQILTIYHKNQALTSMKVLQANSNTRDDEFIFCDLKSLTSLVGTSACPIEAFGSQSYNHIVIDVVTMKAFSNAENRLIKQLIKRVHQRKKKSIIFIIPKIEQDITERLLNRLFEETDFDVEKYMTIEDDDNNFLDLTDESQVKILNESRVIFQEKEVALNSLTDKEFCKLLNEEILAKLVFKEILHIGTEPIDDNYRDIRSCFIDRNFQRRITRVNNSILNNTDSFQIVFNSNQIIEADLNTNKEIVIIADHEDEFVQLCNRCNDSIIHWVKYSNEVVYGHVENRVVSNINHVQFRTEVVYLISNSEDDFMKIREVYDDKIIYWLKRGDRYLLRGTHNRHLDIYKRKGKQGTQVIVLSKDEVSEIDLQACSLIIVVSEENKEYTNLLKLTEGLTGNVPIVRWIKYTPTMFWQRTQGTILKIREFLENDPNKERYTPEQLIASSDKVTIIVAEPGMGKSTIMTHLAVNMETDDTAGTRWVVRIDLRNHLNDLKSMEADKGEVTKFIYEAAFELFKKDNDEKKEMSKLVTVDENGKVSFNTDTKISHQKFFQVKLFFYLYKMGKVAVFLDGFNEICPNYKTLVLDLINTLKQTAIQKICIASRPYNIQTELENRLGTFAFEIVPLTENEQVKLLTKLLEKGLKENEIYKRRSRIFVKKIMDMFSQEYGQRFNHLSTFKTIPLHITMIATVYSKEFKEFCGSDNVNLENLLSNLSRNFNVYDLFTTFLAKKLDIIYGGPVKYIMHDKLFLQGRQKTVEEHAWLALFELFTDDELINDLKIDLRTRRRLEEIINHGGLSTGLINRLVDGRPYFVHRTFAELIAADLLACMLDRHNRKYNASAQQFLYKIVTKDSQFWALFKFLNYKLVEMCKNTKDKVILLALLNGDCMKTKRQNFISIRDPFGRSPLHLAGCNLEQCMSVFIKHSSSENLSVQDNLFHWTPLHYAVVSLCYFNYNADVVKDILKITLTEAALNARDSEGKTPIMLAVQLNCEIEVFQFVAIRAANLNLKDYLGKTALHYAVDSTQNNVSRRCGYAARLIEEGASLFISDDEGKTPLNVIFENHNIAMWYTCFKTYTKVTLPLHACDEEIRAKRQLKLQELKKCLKKTLPTVSNAFKVQLLCQENLNDTDFFLRNSLVDVNTQDSEGKTVLHHAAAKCDDVNIFGHFLYYKPGINLKDNFGRTPLHYAADNERKIKILLLNGAYFDDVDIEDLPSDNLLVIINKLFDSVKGNMIDNVQYILRANKCNDEVMVNVTSKDSGKSLLDYAAEKGYKDIIDCLLSYGAWRFTINCNNVNIDLKLFCALKKLNRKNQGTSSHCARYSYTSRPS